MNTNNQGSSESKEILNKKSSAQFTISILSGILLILIIAASSYYGLIRF